jgi:hypothetical protein
LVLGGLGAVLIAAIVIGIIALSGGSSSKHNKGRTNSTSTAASAPATGSTATTTATTATTTARPVARVILAAPTGNKSLAGAAVVVVQGSKIGIVIRATGLPANTSHDAYAVWLYNSPTDTHLLGFVNPGVKSDGVLQAGSPVPANVSHFKQLLVTVETQAKPHAPGTVVLKGALNVP